MQPLSSTNHNTTTFIKNDTDCIDCSNQHSNNQSIVKNSTNRKSDNHERILRSRNPIIYAEKYSVAANNLKLLLYRKNKNEARINS